MAGIAGSLPSTSSHQGHESRANGAEEERTMVPRNRCRVMPENLVTGSVDSARQQGPAKYGGRMARVVLPCGGVSQRPFGDSEKI
jgi:hypothetical protein